jgi:hypothetical protein
MNADENNSGQPPKTPPPPPPPPRMRVITEGVVIREDEKADLESKQK